MLKVSCKYNNNSGKFLISKFSGNQNLCIQALGTHFAFGFPVTVDILFKKVVKRLRQEMIVTSNIVDGLSVSHIQFSNYVIGHVGTGVLDTKYFGDEHVDGRLSILATKKKLDNQINFRIEIFYSKKKFMQKCSQGH